jgi:hypothetical protein
MVASNIPVIGIVMLLLVTGSALIFWPERVRGFMPSAMWSPLFEDFIRTPLYLVLLRITGSIVLLAAVLVVLVVIVYGAPLAP